MRDKLVPVVVALLCIVAVGLGAAALTTDFDGGGSGPSIPETSNDGDERNDTVGGDPETGGAGSGQQPSRGDDECIAGYDQTDISYLVAVFAVGVSVFVFVWTRELMLGAMAFPVVLLPLLLVSLVAFAFFGCPIPGQETAATVAEGNETVRSFGDAFGYGENDPSLVGRLRLGGILLGLITFTFLVAVYLQRRDADSDVGGEVMDLAETTDAEIAAAAGEAADEVGDSPESRNGVYRAWTKMTEVLDVEHPDTSTPREFADAALAAGLDADDVAELTELFETVRYGTTAVTADHERRAQEALRRIEEDHAEVTDGKGESGQTAAASPASGGDDEEDR